MPVSISNIPARPNSDNMPVTEEYDLLWGFYTFSQTVSYEYDDIGLSGLSSTTITINGCFTRNAEGSSNSNCDDITSSNKLFTKYYNLRKNYYPRLISHVQVFYHKLEHKAMKDALNYQIS